MKKTILLLVLILITSCKNSEKQKEISIDFVKTLEGKISDQFQIIMKLTSENGNINGNYFYKKVGGNIKLKGEIKKNGAIILNEFDEVGNQTGIFKGTIDENSKIVGTWSKPNGEKEMSFILLESNSSYETEQKTIKDKNDITNLSGLYKSPYDDGKTLIGEVKIKILEGKKFSFEISIAETRTECFGGLEGIGIINDDGIGNYSGENCGNLSFKFRQNKLEITETDCAGYHGMRCTFDGEYIK
jgi:hypothetical protein